MDARRLRQRVHRVRRQIDQQIGKLTERGLFIKGTVYMLRRKCGKRGCRCEQGALHQTLVLAVPEKGGKRVRRVPKGKHEQWQVLAGRYRRFRRGRAQLVKLFAQLLSLVDELEQQRTIAPPEG